jgi:hypothetical protein
MPGADLKFVLTSPLETADEDNGPQGGGVVLSLHGWPDAPRAALLTSRPARKMARRPLDKRLETMYLDIKVYYRPSEA